MVGERWRAISFEMNKTITTTNVVLTPIHKQANKCVHMHADHQLEITQSGSDGARPVFAEALPSKERSPPEIV